jgi:alkaline phosphatase
VRTLSDCAQGISLHGCGKLRIQWLRQCWCHMKQSILFVVVVIVVPAIPAYPQATNVILFIGDGAGLSSLNAASIYGYGKPQALYIQGMPNLALADTSSAKEWVTDGAASASAWATGHKTRNGVVSMSADAERDVKNGEIYKTVMEYAMEQGLATGVISNDGVAGAAVSSFYAHINNRGKAGEIFQQALNPKFGNGLDVIIGTGRRQISDQTTKMGRDLNADIKARSYTYADSMASLAQLDKSNDRLIVLTDDDQFDFNDAVHQAIVRLSRNPKGFFLVAHSNCATGKSRTSLQRIIDLDKAVSVIGGELKNNTLIIYTADHGYDLRIKGETLTETSKASDHTKILTSVSLEDEHTAEEVPLLATGPGSDRVHGFTSNTAVFHLIMQNFGWEKENGIPVLIK